MLLADTLRDKLPLIEHSVIVTADAVAALYWTSPRDTWHMDDYPTVVPPFDDLWIEFNAPRFGNDDGDFTKRWPDNQPSQWGARILTSEGSLGGLHEALNKCIDAPLLPATLKEFDSQTRWAITMELFIKPSGHPAFSTALRTFALDQDGHVVLYDDGGGRCYLGNFLNTAPEEKIPCEHINSDYLYRATSRYFETAFLAISFMHCRNITLQEKPPHPKENLLHLKNHKHPLLTRRVLIVDHIKTVLRSEGGMDKGNSLKRAIHICRGYFAHYSQEKPLFGRVAGTFWVPQHVRGTRTRGVIEKTYEVK